MNGTSALPALAWPGCDSLRRARSSPSCKPTLVRTEQVWEVAGARLGGNSPAVAWPAGSPTLGAAMCSMMNIPTLASNLVTHACMAAVWEFCAFRQRAGSDGDSG